MWNEKRIIDYLKENLKEKRFIHSIGVRDTAIKLEECYNVDKEKEALAGVIKKSLTY